MQNGKNLKEQQEIYLWYDALMPAAPHGAGQLHAVSFQEKRSFILEVKSCLTLALSPPGFSRGEVSALQRLGL